MRVYRVKRLYMPQGNYASVWCSTKREAQKMANKFQREGPSVGSPYDPQLVASVDKFDFPLRKAEIVSFLNRKGNG